MLLLLGFQALLATSLVLLEALRLELFAAVRAWHLSCQLSSEYSRRIGAIRDSETTSMNMYELIYKADEQLARKLMGKDANEMDGTILSHFNAIIMKLSRSKCCH
jgi:hypothetical protein